MPKLTVSLAQFRIALADPARNWTAVEKWTQEAAKRGSHLMVLPELWSTGYALDRANAFAHPLNSGTFTQVANLATQANICIIGSILEKRGQDITNSAPFFGPKGQMLGLYRKLHLFRLMAEDSYLRPGQSPLIMDLPWGKTAVAICYDLRFPELFRRYALDGARLCIIPAEWPLERIDHWTTLLRARAIENQMYILACNSCGETGGTIFGGHSMVIDPWGKVIASAGEDPALLTVEIDLDRVDEVRKRITVFEDRRPELY